MQKKRMTSDAKSLALTGGRLIDGQGGDPVPKSTVLIENGRITAAGRASGIRVPRGARVLDVAGCTVLPGMIDCHVHSTYRARDMRQHLLNTPTYNVLRSTHILGETLACGVTTARDMGGADAGFREAISEGYVRGPRLLISIVMISQTAGPGDAWVPARIRLPKPIADCIPQHHGTRMMTYFHNKAMERQDPAMNPVNEEDYRHQGPKPQSKEAAMLMLAGIQLVSTGLIGEILTRIYFEGQQRRIYSVSRVIGRSRKAGII